MLFLYFSSISSGLNALAIVILEDVLKLWWDYRGNAPSPLWQGRIAKLLGKIFNKLLAK